MSIYDEMGVRCHDLFDQSFVVDRRESRDSLDLGVLLKIDFLELASSSVGLVDLCGRVLAQPLLVGFLVLLFVHVGDVVVVLQRC